MPVVPLSVVREARCAGVVRSPVVLFARCVERDRVLGVVLIRAGCAGVIACWCGTLMRAAGQCQSPAAQPAIPADRFAREIVRFLVSACAARSRQLNGNPLGGLLLSHLT
jgi:hypothetical protein